MTALRSGEALRETPRLSVFAVIAGLLLLAGVTGCPGTLEGGPWPDAGETGSGGGTGGSSGTGGSGSGGSGSGGSGSGGNGGIVCDAPAMVFKVTCAGSSCHDTGSAFGAFGVDHPETALKGKNALFSTGSCAGKPLIDSANPASSVVLMRAKGGTCGEQMPDKAIDSTVSYLTPGQLDCLTSWVTDQATK